MTIGSVIVEMGIMRERGGVKEGKGKIAGVGWVVLIKIMFGNAYQNGHIFQVWDSKVNPDKNQTYKQLFKVLPASSKKYFDKQVKSYIYTLEGQTSKIVLPASDQKDLSLHQKYLVLHLCIPFGSPWSMELGITDISNTKRRINFTSTQGKQEAKYFFLKYPLMHIERGVWLFLAINVYSFMEPFKDQVFRSLDHITVGSNCHIRRIFTMKEWNHWEIPKSFWFPAEVPQQFQLIEYTDSNSLPKIAMSKGPPIHNRSEPISSKYEKLTPQKKESSVALAKSQVSPNKLTNSKVYNVKPLSLEPLAKAKNSPDVRDSKIKLRINSMKDELKQQSLIKKEKPKKVESKSIFKKEKVNLQKKVEVPAQIRDKKSIFKSPKIEKSFQQDLALAVPDHESSFNFETSHETITHENKLETLAKSQPQDQKWSSEEGEQRPKAKASERKGKKKGKDLRTQVVRENNEIKKTVVSSGGQEPELELIYDEMVGCYYHPETQMYYQLKN